MVVEQLELAILDREVFLEALCKLFFVDEIADADADAVVAVDVARADAAVRRADLVLAARFIAEAVHQAVIRQHDMGAVRDADAGEVDAALGKAIHFFEHDFRVERDAVADDAERAFVEDAGRHEAQLVVLAIDDDGVAGVAAALMAHDDVRLLCEVVDNLALALVAPLGTGYYDSRHSENLL